MQNQFRNRLVTARKISRISQQKLAEATGSQFPLQAVIEYEEGLRDPDGQALFALAAALQVRGIFSVSPALTVPMTVCAKSPSNREKMII